jgi:hypothetical protein
LLNSTIVFVYEYEIALHAIRWASFMLLPPPGPMKELSDYTCSDGDIHFLFCGKCGVRCLAFAG